MRDESLALRDHTIGRANDRKTTATKLQVGLSGSAEDHGTYEMVRENRGTGDVWRARHPQKWRVRLLAPFMG